MHQKESRANIGEVLCTTMSPCALRWRKTARRRDGGKTGMDKRFMVAVFVAGAELQMAVEKKTEVVLEAREDEMLIMSVAGKNDLVGIDVVFSGGGDLFRFGKSRA